MLPVAKTDVDVGADVGVCVDVDGDEAPALGKEHLTVVVQVWHFREVLIAMSSVHSLWSLSTSALMDSSFVVGSQEALTWMAVGHHLVHFDPKICCLALDATNLFDQLKC